MLTTSRVPIQWSLFTELERSIRNNHIEVPGTAPSSSASSGRRRDLHKTRNLESIWILVEASKTKFRAILPGMNPNFVHPCCSPAAARVPLPNARLLLSVRHAPAPQGGAPQGQSLLLEHLRDPDPHLPQRHRAGRRSHL